MSERSALRVERLREMRKKRGWSQRELGRLCGIGEAQINKYENGHIDPSATYLKAMAAALGVSSDYLIGLSDEPLGKVGVELDDDERAVLETLRKEGWRGVIHLGAEKVGR